MSPVRENSSERISRVVFQYASLIGAESETDKLLVLNADLARDLTGADRCSIWLADERRGELWTKVAHGAGEIRIPKGQGLVGACIEQNKTILINDAASDPRFLGSVDKTSGYVTHSVLTLPLHGAEGNVIGALQVLNKPGGFSESDVQILGLASSYAASALETQRLRAEAEAARVLYRELEIARNVQQKLFPQKLPAVTGLEYAGFCRPAKFVGGDYYDFLALADGSFAFTLGDVSGKGIAAAMLMASIQSSLRTQMLRRPESLGHLICDLNSAVYASSTADKYTTLFCALIDPERRTLTYVNAAHVPPMIFRGEEILRLAESTLPVGMFPKIAYESSTVALQQGDLIICFSDGITECCNSTEEFWEETEIEAEVRMCRGTEVVDRVVKGADTFAAGAEQSDDMTIVAVRVTG